MKVIVSTLICTLILAGLPAKVWACSLGLCDMDHSSAQESDKKEKKPSCHGENHEEMREKRTEAKAAKVDGPSVKSDPQVCPCPTNAPVFALFRTAEVDRSYSEYEKLKTACLSVRYYRSEIVSECSRPPPGRTPTLSGHLFVDLQVFLI